MKVIFLDIDGVMNSHVFYEQRHKKLNNRLRRFKYRMKSKIKFVLNGFKTKYVSLSDYVIDPKYFEFDYTFKRLKEETDSLKWEWLSEFCNENDYKICISSVWKNHFKNPDDWNKALISLGFNDGIYVGITGNRQTLRGTEIQEWVDKNPDVEQYVILDDDSDMLPEQKATCFYLVDGWFGLTPNHLYRINRYFTGLGYN
jgi:hypothetical protein